MAQADDQVDSGQFVLVQAKRLADYPSKPVTLDTTTGDSNRNGQSKAWTAHIVLDSGHAKESISESAASCVSGIEVPLATDPLLCGKRQPFVGRAVAGQAAPVNGRLME